MKTYRVNDIFYSLQGEGLRTGSPHIFLRFSGCNLTCRKETEGFDCDTEFVSGRSMTTEEIISQFRKIAAQANWVLITGGEPGLQLDQELVDRLHAEGYRIAIETNGTQELPANIDWICVSPKTAEHTLRVNFAHEVKYVRRDGQGIPKPTIKADNYLLSPAFEGDQLTKDNLSWCVKLCKENPQWRLSVQNHKIWNVP